MTILISAPELRADEVTIEGGAHRHQFRARRLKAGERVRLTDGEGSARWAQILSVGRTNATLRLGDAAPSNERAHEVHLFVAPPKPDRAAWLVEKAAELGVRRIVFIAAERAPRQPGLGTLARLQRIADAALEQSGGSRRTLVEGVWSWSQTLAGVAAFDERWVLDPEGGSLGASAGAGPTALLVGPEGGWSRDELDSLVAGGCQSLTLGPRILRIETAVAIGSALLLARRA